MKQIIKKYSDCRVTNKHYVNNKNQKHGLEIRYWENGDMLYKTNWFNGKEYGLETIFHESNESGGLLDRIKLFFSLKNNIIPYRRIYHL